MIMFDRIELKRISNYILPTLQSSEHFLFVNECISG